MLDHDFPSRYRRSELSPALAALGDFEEASAPDTAAFSMQAEKSWRHLLDEAMSRPAADLVCGIPAYPWPPTEGAERSVARPARGALRRAILSLFL